MEQNLTLKDPVDTSYFAKKKPDLASLKSEVDQLDKIL